MLCRGEVQLPETVTSKLKCRYITHNNPFLLIAPFKIEEAHFKPDLIIFHDVMSDAEIETIKKLSTPRVSCSENKRGNNCSIKPLYDETCQIFVI